MKKVRVHRLIAIAFVLLTIAAIILLALLMHVYKKPPSGSDNNQCFSICHSM